MSTHNVYTQGGIFSSDDQASPNTIPERDGSGDLRCAALRASAGIRNAGYAYKSSMAKTAGFTVDDVTNNAEVFYCDATSGALTVTLPAAALSAGKTLTIFKTTAANTVVIDPNGAELINGAATNTLSSQYAKATIHCDGTAWYIIG